MRVIGHNTFWVSICNENEICYYKLMAIYVIICSSVYLIDTNQIVTVSIEISVMLTTE